MVKMLPPMAPSRRGLLVSQRVLTDRLDVQRVLAAMEGDGEAEAVGNPESAVHEELRHLRRTETPDGCAEQLQPAPEMPLIKALDRQMRRKRPALVARRAQQRRRPEVAHLGEVMRPGIGPDDAQEYRAQQVVAAEFVIETVDGRARSE